MSDAEAHACWSELQCVVCGRPKRAGYAFCPTCTSALTPWVRNWLSDGPSSSHWCDNFRSARRHLELNRTRTRLFSAFRGGWAYTTQTELEAAGYKHLDYARCRVPGCNAHIAWYRDPDFRNIAVNLSDYQPHRTSCADPDYFARQRAAQASAPRAKRSKRRA